MRLQDPNDIAVPPVDPKDELDDSEVDEYEDSDFEDEDDEDEDDDEGEPKTEG